MKAYVLIVDDFDIEGGQNHDVYVFAKKEEAIARMNSLVGFFEKAVGEDNLYEDGSDWVVEKSDSDYLAFIDGRYNENHYSVSVLEREIQ